MAINLNNVVLGGRLVRNVEVKKTTSGISTATFTIAVNRPTSKGKEAVADFISCQAWRSQADFLEKYAHQGSEIVVEGRVQTRNYEGKDGKKVYVTEILCNRVSIASGSGSGTSNNSEPEEPIEPSSDMADEPEQMIVHSDDLPF